MPIYQTTGSLTGIIEDVETAQEYLTRDDMTQYLEEPLRGPVERVRWILHPNGYDYTVEAVTSRSLTDDEAKQLSSWVSGQNSDGLGEGFEQQPFAESYETNQWGDIDEDTYEMASFDWKTNDSTFTRVA